MFTPLHRLCPPARCNSELSCGDSHNSARTAIRSRLCNPNTLAPIQFWHVFSTLFIEMHRFAARRLCFTAPKPCLAYFYKKNDPLTPVRSKYTFAPAFCKRLLSKCAALLGPGSALLRPGPALPREVPTLPRPSPALPPLGSASLCQDPALLRRGLAVLRLSHAWPFSARNAIRSRLCGPSTHSPRPFLRLFAGVKVCYCARVLLLSAQASPNFPQNTIRSRLCGPNTLPPIPFWSVFRICFAKMLCFAAPRLCFTAPWIRACTLGRFLPGWIVTGRWGKPF